MDENTKLQVTQCIENARYPGASGRVGHVGASWIVEALEAYFDITAKPKDK